MIDLGDLSREPWTLLPGQGDFLAEMHTRRFDTLTYARSGTEPEDITLFDRKRHHNIALYASKVKLAQSIVENVGLNPTRAGALVPGQTKPARGARAAGPVGHLPVTAD